MFLNNNTLFMAAWTVNKTSGVTGPSLGLVACSCFPDHAAGVTGPSLGLVACSCFPDHAATGYKHMLSTVHTYVLSHHVPVHC